MGEKINLRITRKNHKADKEKGLATKSILKPNGYARPGRQRGC